MKKVIFGFIALSCVCANIAMADNINIVNKYSWNGYYVGANAGYGWSQHNDINTHATIVAVNTLDPAGSSNIANALTLVGTNHSDINRYAFIGGGQVGYNYLVNNYLLGIELGLNGLANPNATTHMVNTVPLVDFPEAYQSTVSISKKINSLGSLRGRMGFLYTPNLLLYGTGGLAFGGVDFDESIIANESLSSIIYPTASAGNNYSRTRFGWTIGAGVEWMFKPQWSIKVEYAYYDLGDINKSYVLQQVNNLEIPAVTWAAVNITSSARFTLSTLNVGVNYHFC